MQLARIVAGRSLWSLIPFALPSDGCGEARYIAMTRNVHKKFNTWSGRILLLAYIGSLSCAVMHAQKKSRFACPEADQAVTCSAVKTCGSTSSKCMIDVRRSADSANVTPSIPGAKKNQLFCIKVGTTVVWKTSNKNNGFMVSFGSDSPFDPDGPIIGGAKKPITTKASTPGCYRYDVGAFRSGTVYGMSGGTTSELIIFP